MTNIQMIFQINVQHPPFWPFVIMLMVVAVVLYIRAQNINTWTLMMRGAISGKAVHQIIREENAMESTSSGILALMFVLPFALFFYNVGNVLGLGTGTPPFLRFFIILIFIFAVYVVKILALYILQVIFDAKEIFEEQVVGLMNINMVLGLGLIPLNLLMIYGTLVDIHFLMNASFFLWGLSLLLRLYRAYNLGIKKTMNLQNIILYICTLEIIPIVILIETLDDFGIKLL